MRLLSCALLLAAWALSGATAAAEPTVTPPDGPVPIGGFADVLIQGLERPDTLVWQAYPAEPVRVTSAWGTTDPILSVPTHKARKVALWVAWVEDDKVGHRVVEIIIGQPDPEPDPDPDPDPPPPPPDKVSLLLIHETADSDPAFGQMAVLLRQPPFANQLTQRFERFSIIDDDEPVLAGWLPHIRGMQMPVLVIYDEEAKTIVAKREVPQGATAAQFMELIDAD